MSVRISTTTTATDAKYIHKKSQQVPQLTPRPLNRIMTLSRQNKIAVARDNKKIIGWVISEPLVGKVSELGLGFVEKPYRGQGLLYKMLKPLTNNPEESFVFATFEQRIMDSMKEKLDFEPSTLLSITLISRGKFITKRLASSAAARRVATHLSKRKALYGIRMAKET